MYIIRADVFNGHSLKRIMGSLLLSAPGAHSEARSVSGSFYYY